MPVNFRSHLANVASEVEKLRIRNRTQIASRSDLVSKTKKIPGLYWIETNMPIENISKAIKSCSGVCKRTRTTNPDGIGFTQAIKGYQIIYAGTESDLQKRLLEHLFNEGDKGTTKMSMKIDCAMFSDYKWFISCVYIKDYPTRYAIEAWWRLNIGWPPFCIR
jgi:hypothetical protein